MKFREDVVEKQNNCKKKMKENVSNLNNELENTKKNWYCFFV